MFLSAQRVFTGRTDRLLEDHVVEISDGQVVGIRPRRRDSVVPGLVDLGDVTVLPGLIDVHQHLAFDASTDPVAQLNADDDPTLLLRMRSAAMRALAVGITTIRDLGDRSYLSLALRDWFAAGGEVGPRIVASGPPITTRNGHCWFLGGEVDGPEGVRAGVRERVARGVDVIKVMASGGNMTPTVGPHESQFGLPELAVAIEEAHAAGLPLAVHAHGVQAVRDALAVGADSIEHCTFFTADGVDAAPDVLAELAASTSVISMTAAVLPGDRVIYPAIARAAQRHSRQPHHPLPARRPRRVQQRRRGRTQQTSRRPSLWRGQLPSDARDDQHRSHRESHRRGGRSVWHRRPHRHDRSRQGRRSPGRRWQPTRGPRRAPRHTCGVRAAAAPSQSSPEPRETTGRRPNEPGVDRTGSRIRAWQRPGVLGCPVSSSRRLREHDRRIGLRRATADPVVTGAQGQDGLVGRVQESRATRHRRGRRASVGCRRR